jgi:5-hydroxyisourate hydrolase
MSSISTHVLDAVVGRPASGIAVLLERRADSTWIDAGIGTTDEDGRCRDLCVDAVAGTYRITFTVGAYFESSRRVSIYPEVAIVFLVDGVRKYHIPLLLSDNSYTTYLGS